MRSAFRTISLAKPAMSPFIVNMFFAEAFVEYRQSAKLFFQIQARFFELKQQLLKESSAHIQYADQLDYASLRQMIKLTVLMRNQEFKLYYDRRLQKEADLRQAYAESNEEKRDVWVTSTDYGWDVHYKTRDAYMRERQAKMRS